MCYSLLEIKSFVSLKNESLLFWTRERFKRGSQVLQNLRRGWGSDRFINILGGLGKKGYPGGCYGGGYQCR